MSGRVVLVPPTRVPRWFENFTARHGEAVFRVENGALHAAAADEASATARLPWDRPFSGPPDPAALASAALVETRWGLLLVRRGGFGVAAGTAPAPALTKVGRRHVQGKTKAGGWSQQRFARRRDNQAREAFGAAADHAHRVLVQEAGGVDALVCGGDRAAVEEVLADPRLGEVAARRTGRWLPVPDPTRQVLEQAVRDAWSVAVTVTDPDGS